MKNCGPKIGGTPSRNAFQSGLNKSWKAVKKETPRTSTVKPVGRRGGGTVGNR